MHMAIHIWVNTAFFDGNWKSALNRFMILFENRLADFI